MYTKKTNLRTEYRQQENQRVQDSPSLEAKFPELKTLTVNLAHFDATGSRKGGQLKYTVDRKSTRLNSSHVRISYAVFCLKKKKNNEANITSRHGLEGRAWPCSGAAAKPDT